jgi:cellulose synthase (UDP-forming)
VSARTCSTEEPLQLRDPRLGTPKWRSPGEWRLVDRKLRLLLPVSVLLAIWYFEWLLRPSRVGDPVLYGLLVSAELFNLLQGAGFWWTCWRGRDRPDAPPIPAPAPWVDVLIPVYNEPVDVVGATVAAAVAMEGAPVAVHLLDDAGRDELAELAYRCGAHYVRRAGNEGAKAGNLNHALGVTDAPYIVVFDCDHVPSPRFLEPTLGWLQDPAVAYVQTPQYYANSSSGRLAAAAASQQALFFGGIARGKDALGSMFCCGTNFVFRRSALEEVGGFPEGSLTEDFALSIKLHELGWRSVYVNEVLAQGLGPEDMASYVSQQQRWARGCLASVPAVIKAELPFKVRLQYLLSSMFFLSGWTFGLYMALPCVRIFTGAQPLAGTTADQFLLHFAPYFVIGLITVGVVGAGTYTYDAFALLIASYAIQVLSTLYVLSRRKGRFVVTAKHGRDGPQPTTVLPALLAMAGLSAATVYGLDGNITAAMLNNVAFAVFHICVLLSGAWAALTGRRPAAALPSDRFHLDELADSPI